ncbi:MAG TPA: c-type cytochrome [Ignavibacteriaceae bacterium]|nr:c-type cytochrome [Ignavibacterium sp.]HRN26640.1 c-type cytochrome [Ignavibacteriaceae bacterium]HRP91944.1 c-type cytochrome [Ignavibacteriaceae bacterium]HRQ54274.1 c-type cytochrome [Ignavibacteriaceae bacterium]
MNKNVFFKHSLIPIATILLFLSVGCVQEQQKKEMTHSELVERGKFLVAVGGCTDCHSPKVFGPQGPKTDTTRFLAGYPAENPLPKVEMNMVQPGKWVLFSQDITAAVGPWGVSFAANLTPDNETGIGTWQSEMFVNAMRKGKHLGAGRPILPPMPWENVGKLSDEDLNAIFYYLKSIKPIKNKVPEPINPNQLTALK